MTPASLTESRAAKTAAHASPAGVAFVSFDSNMFGSERSLLHLLANLDRAQVAPRLVLVRPGPLADAARDLGVEVSVLPWLEGPFGADLHRVAVAALRLSVWLRRRRVRIVELNRLSFGHLVVLSAAARLAGCKTVARVRMHSPRLSVFQKLTLLLADLIVPVSAGCIARWWDGWTPRALARRVRVMHNGRDVAALSRVPRDPALLRALGIPDGALVAGMVGAVISNKRQDLFLRAAETVLRECPDAWFVIVGGGLDESSKAYAESLSRFLEGKPLAARVVFAGYRDDALALMKNFDLLVVPSDQEAFAGVIVEAMALGVPVVASRVDGTPELLDDGKTGLLVDRQDPALYAAAAVRLLRERALARRVAADARRWVDRLDAPVVARAMEGVYARLLGGSPALDAV